jgi:hypothetical protein
MVIALSPPAMIRANTMIVLISNEKLYHLNKSKLTASGLKTRNTNSKHITTARTLKTGRAGRYSG